MTDLSIAHAVPPPAPFPWFGGKSKVAAPIWERLGPVSNYVEPFFGSGAVLLQRPQPFTGPETINDADGFVANAWRAIARDPEATATHADWPVNEVDLHARHAWLVGQRGDLTTRLMGDPEYFDAKIAGWWLWGICAWIGGGWCSGNGPWQISDGRLVDTRLQAEGDAGRGINRKLPHLGDAGRGINRKLPHLGNAGRGINRKLPHLGNAGQGINRQLPHLGDAGRGAFITDWFAALSARLREVRICCGDWTRVMGNSVTIKHAGITGVLLDPPYADTAGRDGDLYAVDCQQVAHAAREWALAHGDDPRLRIALCGYEGEHDMPATWSAFTWKAKGGYGLQGDKAGRANAARERIWFSPHCLSGRNRQIGLGLEAAA